MTSDIKAAGSPENGLLEIVESECLIFLKILTPIVGGEGRKLYFKFQIKWVKACVEIFIWAGSNYGPNS